MSGQTLAFPSLESSQSSAGPPRSQRLLSPGRGSSPSSSYACSTCPFSPPPRLLSSGVPLVPRRNPDLRFNSFFSWTMALESRPAHPPREPFRPSSAHRFERGPCSSYGKSRGRGVPRSSCLSLSFLSSARCSSVPPPCQSLSSFPALPLTSHSFLPFGPPLGSGQMAESALFPSCLSPAYISPSPCFPPRARCSPPCLSETCSPSPSLRYRAPYLRCSVGPASICSSGSLPLRNPALPRLSPLRAHPRHTVGVASCASSLPTANHNADSSTASRVAADDAARAKKARVDSGLAGALSGIACATLLQPLDVIKTQQQVATPRTSLSQILNRTAPEKWYVSWLLSVL